MNATVACIDNVTCAAASGRAKQPPWLIPYTAQQVPAQVASDAQPGKVISHAHTFHDSQLKPKNKSSKCMCLPETGIIA